MTGVWISKPYLPIGAKLGSVRRLPEIERMQLNMERVDECVFKFGANLFFLVVILLWVGGMSSILFLGMKFTVGVRVPPEIEEEGMDSSKHGGLVDYASPGPKAAAGAEA